MQPYLVFCGERLHIQGPCLLTGVFAGVDFAPSKQPWIQAHSLFQLKRYESTNQRWMKMKTSSETSSGSRWLAGADFLSTRGHGDGSECGADGFNILRAGKSDAPTQFPVRSEIHNCAFLQAWGAARKVSKDDWLEWLRRLSVVLLKESSSPALRSCWSLAQTYIPLARYTLTDMSTF